MRSFAKVAVVGVSSVVLFKLFATILFPLLGLMFGLVLLTVKIALIAAVVFFVYSLIRKPKDDESMDGEIVVEAEPVADEDEGKDEDE